jgi:hypothetical protein
VQVIELLRGDYAFDSLEALRLQIAEDCKAARRVLADEPPEAIEHATPLSTPP